MKKRVLVVDDDAAVRASLKKVLQEANYEVVLAADGQEAVDRFDPAQIDLLFLDLNLPSQGGWDVFEQVTTRYPFVPVIVITGLPNQYFTALAAGVGALMEKPIDVPALLKTMDELLAEPKEKRLRRLCGQLDDTRYVLPDAQGSLKLLRVRNGTPLRWKLPGSAFPSISAFLRHKENQRENSER